MPTATPGDPVSGPEDSAGILETLDAVLGHMSGCPVAEELRTSLAEGECGAVVLEHRQLRLLVEDVRSRDSELRTFQSTVAGWVNVAVGSGLFADLIDNGEMAPLLAKLEALQDFAIDRLLEGCAPQVDALHQLSEEIVATLGSLTPNRVVVLNLPVGNTIPCRSVHPRRFVE